VANRCGANPDIPLGASPFAYDSCAGSTVPPVLKFDSSGKLLKSFGADMFIFSHKIYVDWDGNVWVVDERSRNEREREKNPEEKAKGHVVVKFSPDGNVLLTLGKAGVAGNPPHALTEPTSVVTARNGDIFIAEGHSGQNDDAGPDTVARISKFTKDGKFIKSLVGWDRGEENSGRHMTSLWIRKDGFSSLTGGTCVSRSSIRTARSSPNGSSSVVQAAFTYGTT
jgi:hypothetical protein